MSDFDDLKKRNKIQRGSINLKPSKQLCEWISKEGYSPTLIFNDACRKLGYKGD